MRKTIKLFLLKKFPFIPFSSYKRKFYSFKFTSVLRFIKVQNSLSGSQNLLYSNLSLVEREYLNDLLEFEEYETVTGLRFDSPESAIRHYIREGEKSGFSISSAFDPNYYLTQVQERGDQKSVVLPLVIDYSRRGEKAGYLPNKLFNPIYYRNKYPDLQNTDLILLQHFIKFGIIEARNPNPFFPMGTFLELSSVLYPHRELRFKFLASFSSTENLGKLKIEFVKSAVNGLNEFLNSDMRLDFSTKCDVQVTVIIPVWNKDYFTLKVLLNLLPLKDEIKIVLIDNGSNDNTGLILARVNGIKVVGNSKNQGFVKAVNQGLEEVTTEFVLLLNNDAQIEINAIKLALSNFKNPDVGAVVAKVILPNGLLQEAGSFLDKNLSAQGYLRNHLPDTELAEVRRVVDFGSGLFLLLRTKLFNQVGGLDEAFQPAYGEEVDLCLKLKRLGKNTIYDPRVIVNHFEFGSAQHGNDAIKLQIEHREILHERYREDFKDRPFYDLENAHLLSRWPGKKSRPLLIIDDRPPLKTQGAGSPRMESIVTNLVNNNNRSLAIYFFSTDPSSSMQLISEARQIYPDVHFFRESSLDEALNTLLSMSITRPVIWASRIHNLEILLKRIEEMGFNRNDFYIIYDSEAIVSMRHLSGISKLSPLYYFASKSVEIEISKAAKADMIVAVQENEKELFVKQAGPDRVHHLGHGMTVKEIIEPFCGREDILFVGRLTDSSSPNFQGLLWFIHNCFPALREELNCKLKIVGMISEKNASELEVEGVEIFGPVPNLDEVFSRTRIFIAPTFTAAGIPHKVHEAASYGLPAVITSILAEQLRWSNLEECLVANEKQTFIDQCIRIYRDKSLWSEISSKSQNAMSSECSIPIFRENLNQILDAAGIDDATK
jgi:GT2 family glycosyltransferase